MNAILSSISSLGIFYVIPFAAWWLFFRAPLGRRRTTVRRTIPAPVAAVWRRIDPRNLDFSWNPHWEQRDASQKGDDPLTVDYWARPRGSGPEFSRKVETWPKIVPGEHLTGCVGYRGDVAIETSELQFERMDLREVVGGNPRFAVDGWGGARTLRL
jgi:hypothetical protein